MTKMQKLMFPRSIRKSLLAAEAAKRVPKYRGFMMTHVIDRPAFVVMPNGERVAYEGP